MTTLHTPADLIPLLEEHGGAAYFGEPVSILEHSLQAAHFAQIAGATQATVVAALLHDVGHMLHGLDEHIADEGVDGHHEEVAADYLARWFGEEVTRPIRLHVPAKRFLCWQDPQYLEQLSPSSLLSLGLQGGPMSDAEAAEFLGGPFAGEAIRLRHWDDEAKIPGLKVPSAAEYLDVVLAVAKEP